MMEIVKLFLASSVVEFEEERRELGDFIGLLNNIFIKEDRYIELIMCEDLSNSIAQSRKQEEYNQHIRESQYFCIILGERVGEYTIEEFHVAVEEFQKKGKPHIIVCFYCPSFRKKPEKSITEFREYLEQNKYHYQEYQYLDLIKFRLLSEMASHFNEGKRIRVESNQVMLDDRVILTLRGLTNEKWGKNR